MDVWHLRGKNAKALRLTIELSEQLAIELSQREANKEKTTKATRHTKQDDCLLHTMSGKRCDSDSNLKDYSIPAPMLTDLRTQTPTWRRGTTALTTGRGKGRRGNGLHGFEVLDMRDVGVKANI
ncbi:hypothetical protein D1007_16725 [Hordeum vulgare]|nr:hypothetical protein D1007_16725 [Hordeum vulgare]